MAVAISALNRKNKLWQNVREANNNKYPVSGQTTVLDSIRNLSTTNDSNARKLIAHPDLPKNSFYLADGKASGDTGLDQDAFLRFCIAGIEINVSATGTSAGCAAIKCPEAPDVDIYPATNAVDKVHKVGDFILVDDDAYVCIKDADVPTGPNVEGYWEKRDHVAREDLHGIELFLVKLGSGSDSVPVVYPNGNTQYAFSSAYGISFTDEGMPQGYSAYGDWDTETRGYGAVWEELSSDQKEVFIARNDNNIYVEDGIYYQWQFRFRSIRGIGCSWTVLDGEKDTTSYYARVLRQKEGIGSYVIPQGMRTTPKDIGDLDSDRGQYINGEYNLKPRAHDLKSYIAQDDFGNILADRAVNGECYWYTLASTTRFNRGCYHPLRNPMGTAHFAGGGDTTDGGSTLHYRRIWTNLVGTNGRKSMSERSLAHFFMDATGYGLDDGGLRSTYNTSGFDSGTYFSIHEDNGVYHTREENNLDNVQLYCYDTIHINQINDLRNSAFPFDGDVDTLIQEFLTHGNYDSRKVTGWAPIQKLKVEFSEITKSGAGYSTANNSTYVKFPLGSMKTATKLKGIDPKGTPNFDSRTYTKPIGYLIYNTEIFEVSYAYSDESAGEDYVYLTPRYYNIQTTIGGTMTGANWSFISFAESDINLNYHFQIGLCSTPDRLNQLIDLQGVDHILGGVWSIQVPREGGYYYHMPKKVIDRYSRFRTSDRGVKYVLDGSGNWTDVSNAWYKAMTVTDVYLHFFSTYANPFLPVNRYNKSYDGKLSKLYASSTSVGPMAGLCEWLVGRVSTANESDGVGIAVGSELTNWALEVNDGSLDYRTKEIMVHEPFDIPGQEYIGDGHDFRSAVKFFGMFTKTSERIFLVIGAQELYWDIGADHGGEFTTVDSTTYSNWVPGNNYQVQNGPFAGSWRCVQPSTSKLNDSGSWTRDYDGQLRGLSGEVTFIPWQGSGWGEDNELNVTANYWYREKDSNGNAILLTRNRLALPVGYDFPIR